MKTLNTRDKIIVLVVIFGIVLYGFYSLLYSPLKEESDSLASEIKEIQQSYPKDNIATLENRFNELNIEKNDFQNQIEEIKEVRNFGDANYQEFITFLGEKATMHDVEVTKITKEEILPVNSYWERNFEMKVEGNYTDLVKYVNTMYTYETYFVIKGLNITEVSTVPMTNKVESGDDTLQKGIEYNWFNRFSEKLDSTIPTEYLLDKEEIKVTVDGEEKETIKKEKSPEYLNERMQIHFTFSFISLEEPSEE